MLWTISKPWLRFDFEPHWPEVSSYYKGSKQTHTSDGSDVVKYNLHVQILFAVVSHRECDIGPGSRS